MSSIVSSSSSRAPLAGSSWGFSGNPVPSQFTELCRLLNLATPAVRNLGTFIRYQPDADTVSVRIIYGMTLDDIDATRQPKGKLVVLPDHKNIAIADTPRVRQIFEVVIDPKSLYAWNLMTLPEWAVDVLLDGHFGTEDTILGREFFWKDESSSQVYLTSVAGVTITRAYEVFLVFAAAIPGPWTGNGTKRGYAIGQFFGKGSGKKTIYTEGFAK